MHNVRSPSLEPRLRNNDDIPGENVDISIDLAALDQILDPNTVLLLLAIDDAYDTGAVTIGADKILESMLKSVNAATDEYCLTSESTTGDFEWQACSATSGDLLADGTVPLTANWDVGAYTLTGTQFISDIATGTAPMVVASTTVVANLNADTLDGAEGAAYEPALTDTAALEAALSDMTTIWDAADEGITGVNNLLYDFSAVVQGADVDEGIRLPTWADVTFSGVTEGLLAYSTVSDALKRRSRIRISVN